MGGGNLTRGWLVIGGALIVLAAILAFLTKKGIKKGEKNKRKVNNKSVNKPLKIQRRKAKKPATKKIFTDVKANKVLKKYA